MRLGDIIQLAVHDPVEFYYKLQYKLRAPPAVNYNYAVDQDWRQKLGVSDDDRAQTERLWPVVLKTLENRGIQPGPESYLGWNDADPAFIQAIWCLIRRLNATKIVETGVAHGVTSRFILEALGPSSGHLWSIDLPPPVSASIDNQIGVAVTNGPTNKWIFIEGSSRRRLPSLLKRIAPIDLFIHDSEHSEYNMQFEMSMAWPALRPGGALVVDDVDNNSSFHDFSVTVRATKIIGEAEPIRPDVRRFNQKGLFGILIKSPD